MARRPGAGHPPSQPTRRDLAVFGLLLGPFLAVAGILLARRVWLPVGWAVWLTGGALWAAFLAVPRWREPIYVGWIRATYPVGWVVTHLLLTLVHVIVITPIAILMRVVGVDPMDRRRDGDGSTYWAPRDVDRDVETYFRQY